MIKLGLVFLVLGVCSPFLLQQPIGFGRGLGRESGRVWGGVPLKSSRVTPPAARSLYRSPKQTIALLTEISKTLRSTNPQTTVTRSLQASRAVSKTLQNLASIASETGGAASLPAALRILFENLGGTYVKLGQFIASSPTLFPPEYVSEFVKLLDSTDPIPVAEIKKVIASEVGLDKFTYLDEKPLGSASVSQVHRARVGDRDVVIKVRKPGIEASLKADLSFLYISSVILEFIDPNLKKTSLANIVSDIRESMLGELDFLQEGQKLIEFREFLSREGIQNVIAPEPLMDMSTKKVLVMDYIDGVSMLDKETMEKDGFGGGVGSEQTIITALNTWTMSVLSMPWFHADVHAGNLLVTKDGEVAFIDFGITGQISPAIFEAVTNLSAALAAADYRGMAEAMMKMGATEETVDIDKFGRDIERVMMGLSDVSGTVGVSQVGDEIGVSVNVDESELTQVLLDVVAVTEENGLKLPREFGLLVKQTLYFDRYLKILAPDLDVMGDERVNNLGGGGGGGSRGGGDDAPVEVEVIR
ncbi:hypothetical protein TrVE_jg9180 [Triparma verrucosa]|uniref:Protein kinase domain-containing protein n=1 Tax=Triparma verrucosa TaxID=1606542 RepID=A0A9W7BYW6_9STRA|nr:hypothetical protein TrVE_jg9180 [Triparma verrucosa]